MGALLASRILIFGEDPQTEEFLVRAFSEQAFRPVTALKGRSIPFQLGLVQPDLIVLDAPPPHGNRWQILQQIRELSFVPIIALIAPDHLDARVESLELGADFSMAKPVNANELRARARALLRRAQYVAQTAA